MASNNYIYKMSNAGGLSNITRYVDMLAGNTTWNPWEPAGAYDALATVTVPSGGAASVTFAGIPTGYKHLEIRGIGFNSGGNAMVMNFNSDTGSNYWWHRLAGNGSTASASNSAGASTFISLLSLAGLGASTAPAASVVSILDYANINKFKTARHLGGLDNNGSGGIELDSGMWNSTSAVTSITLYPFSGSFGQYSSYSLYGVK